MKWMLKTIVVCAVLITTAQAVAAEDWRGIVPLRSTRADVVRVFGECTDASQDCEFMLPNEEVRIRFSSRYRCPDGMPVDTVLLIERELETGTTLQALGVDRRRFKTFKLGYRNSDYRGYLDEKSGLLMKSLKDDIFQINYLPKKDERLICQSFYGRLRELVAVFYPHVPVVDLQCPVSAKFGETITVWATHPQDGRRILFVWKAGDRIVEGQNGRRLLFDTSGLTGDSINIVVEQHDGEGHVVATSCTVKLVRQ